MKLLEFCIRPTSNYTPGGQQRSRQFTPISQTVKDPKTGRNGGGSSGPLSRSAQLSVSPVHLGRSSTVVCLWRYGQENQQISAIVDDQKLLQPIAVFAMALVCWQRMKFWLTDLWNLDAMDISIIPACCFCMLFALSLFCVGRRADKNAFVCTCLFIRILESAIWDLCDAGASVKMLVSHGLFELINVYSPLRIWLVAFNMVISYRGL